jgi:hypothetical protein
MTCNNVRTCNKVKDAMKAYWGSGGIALRILDLGIRWRVAKFLEVTVLSKPEVVLMIIRSVLCT